MGRRRKGYNKGKKVGPKVRPEPEILQVDEEAIRESLDKLWQSINKTEQRQHEELERNLHEPKKVPLSNNELESVLGALQDGVRPGPGQEDLDLLADIVCELIERRKQDENKFTLRGDGGRGMWISERNRFWYKPQGRWCPDFMSDSTHYFAPDGTRLLTMTGLEIMQHPELKERNSERAMQLWFEEQAKKEAQKW